jgi:hypothetical protein
MAASVARRMDFVATIRLPLTSGATMVAPGIERGD